MEKNYKVTVYASADILVSAKSKEEACNKALKVTDLAHVDYAEAEEETDQNN